MMVKQKMMMVQRRKNWMVNRMIGKSIWMSVMVIMVVVKMMRYYMVEITMRKMRKIRKILMMWCCHDKLLVKNGII